ncbi:MAG: hypothetical protein A2Y40_03320 [Candidatus Margulisbacteria bacterium GWF2_35_9]|nr:MAG: hypothetical protein A2Y40_03320 [Candidatus Margulisbacteria bacterium GWF2_35_9]
MQLSEIISSDKFFRSIEMFPPKQDETIPNIIDDINQLKPYDLAYISVTYGAGGSTQGRSLKLIEGLAKQFDIMAHFTCVNTTRSQIDAFMGKLRALGVHNILALRGDIPAGMTKDEVLSDFHYASELVKYLKETTKMDIAVAAYPEIHPESPTPEQCYDALILKANQGAELLITQLFFDNDIFKRFFETLHKKGLQIPVIPGIMPITNFNGIKKIIELSNTKLPETLNNKLTKHKDDSDAVFEIGMEYALKQSRDLKLFGVKGIHFYSLNKRKNVEPLLKEI